MKIKLKIEEKQLDEQSLRKGLVLFKENSKTRLEEELIKMNENKNNYISRFNYPDLAKKCILTALEFHKIYESDNRAKLK